MYHVYLFFSFFRGHISLSLDELVSYKLYVKNTVSIFLRNQVSNKPGPEVIKKFNSAEHELFPASKY